MLAIPLIRTDKSDSLTPIERTTLNCEQVITALMMHATVSDPDLSAAEVDAFTLISVATIIPAEA